MPPLTKKKLVSEPRTSIGRFSTTPYDEAVLSHWLHLVGTKFADSYEAAVLGLLPQPLFSHSSNRRSATFSTRKMLSVFSPSFRKGSTASTHCVLKNGDENVKKQERRLRHIQKRRVAKVRNDGSNPWL